MISYKAEEVGINVILTEESYTSQASFLDYDNIPTYSKDNKEKHKFSGRRIERGLYKTKDGKLINADVNGALNIMTKAVPNAFSKRDIGFLQTIPMGLDEACGQPTSVTRCLSSGLGGNLSPTPKVCLRVSLRYMRKLPLQILVKIKW